VKMRMFGGVMGFDVERVVGFIIKEHETTVSLRIGGTNTYDITVGEETLKDELDEWLTMELCESDG